MKFQEIWEYLIQKGIDDESITLKYLPSQIVNYIFMLINGIVEQTHLKKIALEHENVQLSYEIIEKITLDLISDYLLE